MNETIERNFTYHKPTEFKQQVYPKLRDKAKELAYLINDLVPDGREKSLAMTKLEEVVMWANAGVSRHKEENKEKKIYASVNEKLFKRSPSDGRWAVTGLIDKEHPCGTLFEVKCFIRNEQAQRQALIENLLHETREYPIMWLDFFCEDENGKMIELDPLSL
jgi:hypothetical protein